MHAWCGIAVQEEGGSPGCEWIAKVDVRAPPPRVAPDEGEGLLVLEVREPASAEPDDARAVPPGLRPVGMKRTAARGWRPSLILGLRCARVRSGEGGSQRISTAR